ncbi:MULTISPECIES: tautomerase family protein [unclassified Burkholderia]|uniref:tautomerase family protein n=1 Tax=unclassified Burkholderia TaxID=2613784 RepID=UPI00141F7560|nr:MULTISPECIES: tautomerase family protein [unclassified Burkholderia]NIE82313.1 4-oxalocrotonate tautomerase [Burkholderia sp. Tr-860]NIF62800.1 4-oxalocrotonate tautomerase [Burkholderia sp. Cy-647]NIF71163.1 4-oxalocrotonate tautomerase [Burkholderia sp. Ap-962]NIF94601.1 4-oxalocrotonate tautomerase [Burkholderia sp. Ax-1720]
MPIVHISLLEGRDPSLVKQCIKEVARSIHDTLGAPLETIRVIATIVPAQYWAVGDQTKDEPPAAGDDAR